MKGQKIHMVGIGGIGMSALAQLYAHEGAIVTGSDRSEQPTTQMLEKKGIPVFIGGHADNVPKDAELLVYSDAVVEGSEGYVERQRAQELGIKEMSYFEALGKVAEGKKTIAVAGTNGKTTTTAMLAKILIDAGLDPTVVVGSIVSEWGSNFRAGKSDLFVVEACEYKNHFLKFHPAVLVITNIEFEHTDFFASLADVEAAFAQARAQAGVVVEHAQYAKESVPDLLVPGEFNKDNARAAKAAAKVVAPELADVAIDASLAMFRGTWRRFEYKGKTLGGADLYDDYAHHPTAIYKTIAAAREKFPGKQVIVFFHPHLYSRTRDLFDEFATALATADHAFVLPVFAAREPHNASVSNEALAKAIQKNGGKAEAIGDMEEVTEKIKSFGAGALVFTMGAGDVYKAGEQALAK